MYAFFLLTIQDSVVSVITNENYCGGAISVSTKQSILKKTMTKIWLSALGPRSLFLTGFVFRGLLVETNIER